MKNTFNSLLLLLITLLLTLPAWAEIYSWTDNNGRKFFSSTPPKNQSSKQVTVRVNSFTNVSIDKSIFNTGNKVIMYSTSWCGYCKKAKQYFKSKNIPFTEYDIENNARAKRQYKKMNGQGVPIILVGKKRLNGFSKSSFERIYN